MIYKTFPLMICIMMLQVSVASACSCLEMTDAGSLEVIEKAELIFEGTVTSMEARPMPEEDFDYTNLPPVPENPFFAQVRIKPVDIYKGKIEGSRITAYVDVVTSCGYAYQVGDYSSFILNQKDDVLVQTDICNGVTAAHWQELQAGKFKQ